jgi:hypothetical protein
LVHPETPSDMSNNVFGTSGDAVNLKSQFYACSMGRLTIIPGDNNSGLIDQTLYEAAGVISVKIDIPLANSMQTLYDAMSLAVQNKLGISSMPGPYQHVMYVVENCYSPDCKGALAFAVVSGWRSIFYGAFYKNPIVQIHEIGHNFGLVS